MILTLHDVAQRVQALEKTNKELEEAFLELVKKVGENIATADGNFQAVLEALQRMDAAMHNGRR